jgi:hypothetical protein
MTAPLQHPLWPEDAPRSRFAAEAAQLAAWLFGLRFFWLAVGVFAGAAGVTFFA